MKGFIKITDLNNQDHFLNINYIYQFIPLTPEHEGNSLVFVTGGANTARIETNTTIEEIVDMVDLAKS